MQQQTHIYENTNLTLLATQLHQHMKRFGYQHVQLPAIESAELFLSKAGDQVIANLLSFERFGKELALRPEFTALAAYRYAQQHLNITPIERWQFNGSVFLDNYSQRDSQYQYMSIGAEIFGMASHIYADAEIIALAAHGLTEIADLDIQIQIGHVGLIRRIVSSYELDSRTERLLMKYVGALVRHEITTDDLLETFDQYLPPTETNTKDLPIGEEAFAENTQQMLDALLDANERGHTMGGRTRIDIAQRLVRKRHRAAERSKVADAAAHLVEWGNFSGEYTEVFPKMRTMVSHNNVHATALLEQWQDTLELVQQMGVPSQRLCITPGLIRDWNYYTGIVFNLTDDKADKSYGGGGRYDELVRLMGANQDVPAIGFAYNVSQIITDMSKHSVQSEPYTIALVVKNSNFSSAILWQKALQETGYTTIVLDTDADFYPTAVTISERGAQFHKQTYQLDQIDALVTAIEANA